jgi:uncharacterized protein (TIGR02145 family)
MKLEFFKNNSFLQGGLQGSFSLMLAAAMLLAGCKEDALETPALAIDRTNIDATAAGGSYTITITGNQPWTAAVSGGATWCTVSPAAGEGDGEVTVTVAASTADAPRVTVVAFTAGAITRAASVLQAAVVHTAAIGAPIDAPAEASNYTVSVTGNSTWTVAVSAGATWCTVSPDAGNGDGEVTIALTENLVTSPRSATVTFTVGAMVMTVNVTQAAAAIILAIDVSEPIAAPAAAGTYPVTVTSNSTWTAGVSAGATWCTVSPAAGEGDGTVTISLAESAADAPRTATVTFTAGTESRTATLIQDISNSFTDPRDNKVYRTVRMPDGRIWFAENLRYTSGLTWNAYANQANGAAFTSYSNGTPAIGSYWCPGAQSTTSVADEASCDVYGPLYTWETAMMVDGKWSDETKTSSAWDETGWSLPSNYYSSGAPGTTAKADLNNGRGNGNRGICPAGWHVPTDREWATMHDALNGTTVFSTQTGSGATGTNEGALLRSAATFSAVTDPGDGTWRVSSEANRGLDTYGFTAVPAGERDYMGYMYSYRSMYASMWSSSVSSDRYAWYRRFMYTDARAYRMQSGAYRASGYSVRCIKD